MATSKHAFLFYPSAYHSHSYSQLGLWIKYKPTGHHTAEVKVVESDTAWVHIDCPDREILVVRNLLNVNPPRPLDGMWHEFVPLSLSNSCGANISLIERYMVNFESHNNKPHHDPKTRVDGSFIKDGKISMSDSGGFQLLTGVSEWVDPKKLGSWYHDNMDEGITLDLPVLGVTDPELVLRTAVIQRNNSRIIRDQNRDTFHLFNVAHGSTTELQHRFRDELEKDPDCGDYICIGGAYNGLISQSVFKIMRFILDPNFKAYRQYHILGVYNTSVLSPVIWLAAQLRKLHRADIAISSDASTAVYSAGNRTMHLQRGFAKNAERLAMGKSKAVGVDFFEKNPYRHLPCNCQVCQSLKYVDIISHVNDAMIAHVLLFHNMLEIKRWVDMMNHFAEVLPFKDYYQLVEQQLNSSPGKATSLATLKMIDCAMTDGLAEAEKRFKHILSTLTWAESGAGGAFGDEETEEPSPFVDLGVDWEQYHLDRLHTMSDRYEKFHEDNHTPDVSHVKKKDLKRAAKKVQMNSTVERVGKKKAVKRTHKVRAGESTHTKKAS